MKHYKLTNQQWKTFANRIIEKNGNPSLQDARECKIPDGYFNELCMRNISSEQLVKNAKLILEKIRD